MVHLVQEDSIQQTTNGSGKSIDATGQPEDKLGHTNGAGDDDSKIDFQIVGELRQLLKKEYEANGADQVYSAAHYEELMDEQSAMTCWRYYIHEDRKTQQALNLMKASLLWRKQNKVDELSPDKLFKECWLKAPIGFVGKTREGKDLVYCVGRNYRKPSDAKVAQVVRDFVTYVIMTFDKKHKDDLEDFVAVFDVSYTTYSNIDLSFVSWLITIPDYFPRRFKRVHIIGIPFLIRPLIRLIISWLPERYKRIVVCGTMEQLLETEVDKDNLPSEIKGNAPDEWRLAPGDAPWAADSDFLDQETIAKMNQSICFNTPEERVKSLIAMQKEHEAKTSAEKSRQ